ncbi:MAG: polysulfide reductase NrfD [Dehalococcoidia bacterium]
MSIHTPSLRELGVGRWGPISLAITAVLSAMVVIGFVAYSRQLVEGEVVTGLRDWGTLGGSPWGVYIAFVVYFIGVSFAGISIAALVRLLRIEALEPITRMAELLTIVSLVLGAFAVLADLGQPLRGIVNLFRYARPQSPFFGTFSLVMAGYLFASLVYFYLAGRRDAYLMAKEPSRLRPLYRWWAAGYHDTPAQRDRHERTSFLLAVAILPLLVTAHSTLGLVFGLMGGRPGWFSALQAPGFVVLAGVSGLGHIAVLAALVRWFVPAARESITPGAFRLLGIFLMVLTTIYLYFTLIEVLTAGYAGHEREQELVALLLWKTYAPYFWTGIAALGAATILGLVQALRGRWNIGAVVAMGILVNIAAIAKRLIIVTPSLTHGSLLPYEHGAYTPTWVEVAIIVGLMSLGALVILAFAKIFPLVPLQSEQSS